MKLTKLLPLLLCSLMLTGCYSYSFNVGDGPQQYRKNTEWNHYLIGGLAPIDISDPQEMAYGEENYEVHVRQTFVNGLISGLTFGIYTPTTTTVTY